MDLGPHAFFIIAAYAVTAIVVGGLILRAVLDHRAQLRALAELEGRGMRRRSEQDSGLRQHNGQAAASRSG
jgi:heme exporter protein D